MPCSVGCPRPPRRAFGRVSPNSPPRQRNAVWLRWIEELDYATIARRLGSTPEAARANVYQGMKKLRRDLVDVWREEAPI